MDAHNKKASAAKQQAKPKNVRHTKKQQGDIIFALDIGTRTVVGILAEKTEDGYKVIAMQEASHEKRSMTDGQIEDIEAVAKVIKKVKSALERQCMIKLTRVCVAAAGRALKTLRHSSKSDVSGKSIDADIIHSAEMDTVRAAEELFAEQEKGSAFYCVGHSVVSLTLDGYRVNKPEGHRGETLETEIIAAFLPAYVVEGLCSAVDMARLEVAGLTLEPIAAMNAVVPQELRMINIALCDIGAGTSDVAASRDGSVVAYGMATYAGDEITESLMKQLLVDFSTAEMIKTSTEDKTEYVDILLEQHSITAAETQKLLMPAAQELARVVCNEIMAANGSAPQAVFLVGGSSRLRGLPELVANGLGIDPSRVAVGRREIMRGISIPKSMEIGAQHATPLGIVVTSSEGVRYDFTTITLNGRKIRALDTERLTVFELTALAGIKPDKLMGRSGSNLSFTINGAETVLRGTPQKPAEITVNGREAPLNASVRKGDEVTIVPAEDGESAAAYLSDYTETEGLFTAEISLMGQTVQAGRFIMVNEDKVTSDREIEDGDVITTVDIPTLGALCTANDIAVSEVLLNGAAAAPDTRLKNGDEITAAPEKPEEPGTEITFNGMPAVFPAKSDGTAPIFLDIAAAFSDDPTELLAHSSTITINGKIARLDEEIHSGDVIVIE